MGSSDFKKNEMKPWQVKSWIIPKVSPDFVCAMEEVLDEYKKPYESTHPRICLDESPKQLISETRPKYVNEKGIEHIDYEYKRNGVADIYMIVEPLAGKREVHIKDNHNRFSWAEIITHISEIMYPRAKEITIIQDNLSAHKKSALYEIHSPKKAREILKRFNFIFTPKHGSWLNIAEIELSVLTRQGIKKHVPTKKLLKEEVTNWYKIRNEKNKKVDWQFKTKDARIKLKRLYPKFNA